MFDFAHLLGGNAKKQANPQAETEEEKKDKDNNQPSNNGKSGGKSSEKDDTDNVDEKDKKNKKTGAEETSDDEEDEKTKAGRVAERARCAAIFSSAEASGRIAMAAHLAFNTSLSAKESIRLLALSPVEDVSASASQPFDARMANLQNYDIGQPASESQNAGNADPVEQGRQAYLKLAGKK